MRRGKEREKAKKDQPLTAAAPKGLTKAAWTWSPPSKRPTTTERTSATTLPGRPGIGEQRGRAMLCCVVMVVVDVGVVYMSRLETVVAVVGRGVCVGKLEARSGCWSFSDAERSENATKERPRTRKVCICCLWLY